MLLERFYKKPLSCRQYLERFVNDGSPSGFTDLYRTSKLTDPFGLKPWFNMYLCTAPQNYFRQLGSIPDNLVKNGDTNWIFFHPDIIEDERLQNGNIKIELADFLRVTPTASSRTVQILSTECSDYVKLHFEGTLGRVNRALPFQKAISGVEITNELIKTIEDNILPEKFSILPETGVRCFELPNLPPLKGIGMIWRSNRPIGINANKIKHIWPLFSLFSTDRLSPLDPKLLIQLIDKSKMDECEFILEQLIFPILDCYFSLISKLGYQVECNAQNLMIGLDDEFNIVSVVIRDIMRFEKDITIRQNNGLSTDYHSAPYKFISSEDELYQIRHSFSFDFKMVYYIIDPIIDLIIEEYGCNRENAEYEIKKYLKNILANLPDNYFPVNGKWYKHGRILLTGKRPYIGYPNPRFR